MLEYDLPNTDIPDGLAEYIPRYLASRGEDLREMFRLLAASDFESLEVLGHNMKGSGACYGFPEISRIGAGLQHSAEQKDSVASGSLLRELEDYLEHLFSASSSSESLERRTLCT